MPSPVAILTTGGTKPRNYKGGALPPGKADSAKQQDLADWFKVPGQDSRDAAYDHLETVKNYIASVNEDKLRGMKDGRLDIKNDPKAKDFVYGFDAFQVDFDNHYRNCYDNGISYLDVDNVEQRTTDFHNKAKGYQEVLNQLLAGKKIDSVTPVPPDEKAPPGAGPPVNTGGFLAAAGGTTTLIIVGTVAFLLISSARR